MKLAISDPGKFALKNAIRAAIVVPAAFAISLEVLGLAEMALFAGFGSIALLVFVDFGGSWRQRLCAYLVLVGGGAVLIAVGTLCSQMTWLAVGAMAITAFTIVFAGVLDGYAAAAQSAAILAFVLASMVPAAPAAIPARLAGWALAAAFSIAATFLLWPRRPPDRLRERTSQAVGALANLMRAVATVEADKHEIRGTTADELADLAANANQAVSRVHREFVAMPHRPSGVGGRLAALGRLVDDLVSFDPIAREQPAPAATGAGFAGERAAVEATVAAALQIAARRLSEDDPGDGGEELGVLLGVLAAAHTDIGRAFLAKVSATRGETDEECLQPSWTRSSGFACSRTARCRSDATRCRPLAPPRRPTRLSLQTRPACASPAALRVPTPICDRSGCAIACAQRPGSPLPSSLPELQTPRTASG